MNRTCVAQLVLAATSAVAAPPVPITEILGVDRSDSITPKQRITWQSEAQSRVDSLCPGDRLQIFVVDGYTLTNRPLLTDAALPPQPASGATLNELLAFRSSVLAFKAKAKLALANAFQASSSSNATDVLSLFDRVGADPSGRREIVVFSDGLHANQELNLERTPLQGLTLSPLIQKLAEAHRWHSKTLAGAEIEFVLASPDVNGPPMGPNDARSLKQFYSVLTSSLGGKLTGFETYLTKGGRCHAMVPKVDTAH
jgi:hypothetical protein